MPQVCSFYFSQFARQTAVDFLNVAVGVVVDDA